MARDYDLSSILGVPFEETPETLAYDLSSKVSVQVSKILDERGMTLKELAAEMGISQPTLCKMLGAKSNMTMKTVARLALALGCDVEEPKIVASDSINKTADSSATTFKATVILNMETGRRKAVQSPQIITECIEA